MGGTGSQSLLIQGRFQLMKNSKEKLDDLLVAIPSDSGQVSTRNITNYRVMNEDEVAIPSDSGQVSTRLG